MNYEIYDVASKVSMMIGISGYFYLMNHIKKMRAFDAKKVFISKNFEVFYLAVEESNFTNKHWNLRSETNPIETKIIESIE
jgi:hypothetical protein